jgi:hypothetical protein
MWAIAEVLSDRADARRGLGGEAVGRIERERDGRLADAGFAGDVGGSGSLGGLLGAGATPADDDVAGLLRSEPV